MNRKFLKSSQHHRLQHELHRAQNAHHYRRILAILEFDKGKPIPEIAQMLEVSNRSIYNWLDTYGKAHHPRVLEDAHRSGRPRLCDKEIDSLVKLLLASSPEQAGLVANNWTVPLLREHLEHTMGQNLSNATVRRELRHLGFVWKRSRYVLAADPELEKKRKIIRQIKELPRRSVLLIEDETDLLLFPPLRSTWSLRGEPAEVFLQGQNARRVIFGAMNFKIGRCWFLARERQRSVDFQAFLHLLRWHYRGWHLALLLDEDSSHTAHASQSLAHEMNITLLWLPKRSPQLNPMDTLWGQAKDIISANRQYASIDDHVNRFIEYLSSLSPYEILHTSGILSKHFWLRRFL